MSLEVVDYVCGMCWQAARMGQSAANPPKLRVLDGQSAAAAGKQMQTIAGAVSGVMPFWSVFLLRFVLCCIWQDMFPKEERFVAPPRCMS